MPTTLNPSDKGPAATLGGGNLTLTGTGGVRTVDRYTTGQYYFEVTCTTVSTVNVGIANTNATLISTVPVGSCIVPQNGIVSLNGSSTGMPTLGALANGNIVCVAFDLNSKLIWFRVGAAGNWNGNAGFAPGGAGGVSIASISLDSILLPAYGFLYASGSSLTANFGATAFSGAVPSGYTSGLPSPSMPPLVAANAGLVREALLTTVPAARSSGLVREVLLANATAATMSGLVREILLVGDPVTAQQYAVTVVS